MRHDMKDIIIEPGRSGGSPRKGRQANRRLEDLPRYEGMRRYPDFKTQSDRLGPVVKYLRSQVGRPWANVWSDICALADAREIRGYHLRTHVLQIVETKPMRVAPGLLIDAKGRMIHAWGWPFFYIDPRTGLLCDADRLLRKSTKRRR